MQDIDEQAQLRPAIGDFRFSTVYAPDPGDPAKLAGTDWVSWLKIGDAANSRTEEKISRLMPSPERKRAASPLWAAIETFYTAWKKGQEIPENGTPLAAWPGVDLALAEALRERKIRTVEDFANLADHVVGTIPVQGIRQRLQSAKAFLKAQQGEAHLAAELAKRDEELKELKRQIEEQGRQLELVTRPAMGPTMNPTEGPAEAPAPAEATEPEQEAA